MHVERWTAPGGRRRLLVRMDQAMAARYERAARLAVPRAPAGPRSYGSARRPDRAVDLGIERSAWRAAVARAAEPGDVAETGDVAACFPSMGERAVRAVARASGGDPGPLLQTLREVRAVGVRGLPIGPVVSSYLADAVLALADAEAMRAGIAPIRWVDDVVFVGSRTTVARAAKAWRHALVELGLAHHEGKRTAVGSAVDLRVRPQTGSSTSDTAARGIIRL